MRLYKDMSDLFKSVCAFDRLYEKKPSKDIDPSDAWSIAGEFPTGSGRHLDPVMTRLKTEANGEDDSDKEGLRVEFRGGVRLSEDKQPQKFIIDLVCDPEHTGLDEDNKKSERTRRDEDEEKDEDGDEDDAPAADDSDKALQFVSYKATPGKGKESSKVFDVLQLRWHTKYGCEGEAGKDSGSKKAGSGWGFFTWFIIMYGVSFLAYESILTCL